MRILFLASAAPLFLASGTIVPTQFGDVPGGSLTMQRSGPGWAPALLLCDGTNVDAIHVLGAPDRNRRATVWTLSKPGLHVQRQALVIGEGDAGMSQLRYPLTLADGTHGLIHTISPGVVDGATTPIVDEVTLGRRTTNCRWSAQTRVLAITGRRSIQVTAVPGHGYRYQSFDYDTDLAETKPIVGHATRASLTINNGRLVDADGNRRSYHFANAGYLYRVSVSIDPRNGGGGVQVTRDGAPIANEPFAAYTAALRP